MGKAGRALRLLRNYVVDPLLGKPSTAGFWWLPEPARVRDQASLRDYHASANPSPLYVMDYKSKLAYRQQNAEGIIVLAYASPIGDQVNPEAAFIYALALHDAWRMTGDVARRDEFLHYAKIFRSTQTPEGDWQYLFDWPHCPAPWTSALAQGRGASVMLRAWMMTGDNSYRESAGLALSRFSTPIEKGGYLAIHALAGVPYYEEYPLRPIAVQNGFMASLIGCFEVAHFGQSSEARALFDQGIHSLVAMTPHYLTSWWSVYDRNPQTSEPNLNTPRYHRLVGAYFDVLSALSGNAELACQRDEWHALETPLSKARALSSKFRWKLRHGVFSS